MRRHTEAGSGFLEESTIDAHVGPDLSSGGRPMESACDVSSGTLRPMRLLERDLADGPLAEVFFDFDLDQ